MTSGQGSLYGGSCPSPALCATGNLYGNLLVASNPTGSAEAWKSAPGGGSVQITDVDCPSVTQCVAVNNNADVMTSANPPLGNWSFTNLRPYAGVEETSGKGASVVGDIILKKARAKGGPRTIEKLQIL